MPSLTLATPSPFFQVPAVSVPYKPIRPLSITLAQLSPLQRQVWEWFLNETPNSEQFGTIAASHPIIAAAIGRTPATVKNAIQRMIKKGLLTRVAHVKGRCGWTEYRMVQIPPPKSRATVTLVGELKELTHNTQTAPSEDIRSLTVAVLPSQRASDLAQCERLTKEHRLDAFRVSANDLMNIWRKRTFQTLDELLLSAERIAFYLRSPESKGIKLPRAWMMNQLKDGMFAEPVGFESREQREVLVQNETLAAEQKRTAENVVQQTAEQDECVRQRNKARVAGLDEAERRRLLRGLPVSCVFSDIADAILETVVGEMMLAA